MRVQGGYGGRPSYPPQQQQQQPPVGEAGAGLFSRLTSRFKTPDGQPGVPAQSQGYGSAGRYGGGPPQYPSQGGAPQACRTPLGVAELVVIIYTSDLAKKKPPSIGRVGGQEGGEGGGVLYP